MGEQQLDEVLSAACLGEAWALRVVYDELAPRVLGYLRGRGAAEPEDLTSEVFLAVLPRLATVTGGAAGLRTLLFSVAHARLVDDLRRRARRGPAVALDDTTVLPTAPSAETVAFGQAGTDRVRQVLAGLPGDQRDVLLLRLVGDLTVDEVATAIGRSAGAVKQLQRRGLLELRAQLADGRVTL
ncbi:MAG: RNA polymerase sigma factor [Pseudorhodobacter sp.]|nr:RNA polymerase sigma factor [Frankiaceae bacterium]